MNSNQLIDAIGAVNDAAVLDAKAFHYTTCKSWRTSAASIW